ncbi:MAG: hypothetical protein H7318_17975 [Oligoflexus sp.]|nr:hypothetical protein [Oligoflexus sp.]
MMKKCLLSAAFVLGIHSTTSFAQAIVVSAPPEDETLTQAFLDADTLFAARDQSPDHGLANTLAAKAAYQKIIDDGAAGADLPRAVERLARTYYFQGEVLIGKTTDAEKKERKAIFRECWEKAITPLSVDNLGTESPIYFYFRASCMAREAEVSSVLERLLALPKLLATFKDATEAFAPVKLADGTLQLNPNSFFEGGGIARVQAAVKGNPEAKGLPGGLFNPEVALSLVDGSIASKGDIVKVEQVPGAVPVALVDTDDSVSGYTLGKFYCENYYRKAITLSVIDGKRADAIALAQTTVDTFTQYLTLDADGNLTEKHITEDIRAETQHCVEEVSKFKATQEALLAAATH